MDIARYISFAQFFGIAEDRGYSGQEAVGRLLAHLRRVSWPVALCGLREVRHYVNPPHDHPKNRLLRRLQACEGWLNDGPLDEFEILCGARPPRKLSDCRRQATLRIFARLEGRWEAMPDPFRGWRTFEQSTRLQPVPHSILADFETVDEYLRSYWQDDSEEPFHQSSANWLAGSVEISRSAMLSWTELAEDVSGEEEIYTTLHVLKSTANEVLRYSWEELIEIAKDHPRQSHFIEAVKDDLKLGDRPWTVVDLRAAYREAGWQPKPGNPNLMRDV